MNKSGKEKNIFRNIPAFAKYENPNNFDEYHAELIPKLSKIILIFLFFYIII